MSAIPEKKDFLKNKIEHFDILSFDSTSLVNQYEKMAFQSRNIASASKLYEAMLKDGDCSVILCMAGSLFSAGLKKIVHDMVMNNMVDAVVSTGAIIFDQDMFEALGFPHYIGTPSVDDKLLNELHIDRIYDTYIDEDQLRIADETIAGIASGLSGAVSSRGFVYKVGEYLFKNVNDIERRNSVIYACYKKDVPIFIPALSDSCAGFGLVMMREKNPDSDFAIDSVRDFHELTQIKVNSADTGLFMVGGGVPKNFAQDIVVCADIIKGESSLHKYAIQVTVADERDGGLSGSTLKEANSWGKVDSSSEQMVYCEATIALPIIASYAFHSGAWKGRKQRSFNSLFTASTVS